MKASSDGNEKVTSIYLRRRATKGFDEFPDVWRDPAIIVPQTKLYGTYYWVTPHCLQNQLALVLINCLCPANLPQGICWGVECELIFVDFCELKMVDFF